MPVCRDQNQSKTRLAKRNGATRTCRAADRCVGGEKADDAERRGKHHGDQSPPRQAGEYVLPAVSPVVCAFHFSTSSTCTWFYAPGLQTDSRAGGYFQPAHDVVAAVLEDVVESPVFAVKDLVAGRVRMPTITP